ncbi:MAG: cob(I)yrinic acid a,c-diamide adenosyltransferase [Bdellovibrionaceae bacterium]|jgi:cob(I)alamin adenosyltransferase|nr:cob(I)yrinic acid a,c-diamide adenosyltransferase [Pseudobdellovibrionaceae bacterium]
MKIYTKTGDKGETSLLSGKRVSKSHPRIATYGNLDTLNSSIGLIISTHHHSHLEPLNNELLVTQMNLLKSIQNELFNLGSLIACDKASLLERLAPFNADLIQQMETQIDVMDTVLPALKNFILPGGHPSAAHAHLARTLTRSCEREVIHLLNSNEEINIDDQAIALLNRLSDYLFTLSRLINHFANESETLWSNS